MKRPIVLTIAGSDSGGGAGIQADLKTIAAHGCYGASAITAITAQNTRGVVQVEDLSPEIVAAQIDAVLGDIGCDALKTGMLSKPHLIRAVTGALARHRPANLVVDPVMVSKSGDRLLSREAVETIRAELFPMAALITPNLEEAEELLGALPGSEQEMEDAARALADFGPGAVLLKGGHLKDSREAVDVLWDGREMHRLRSPRLEVRHTHGTGCTLSAAIASNLAWGLPLARAVSAAKLFLNKAMLHAYEIGTGIGPVNHLWHLESEIRSVLQSIDKEE